MPRQKPEMTDSAFSRLVQTCKNLTQGVELVRQTLNIQGSASGSATHITVMHTCTVFKIRSCNNNQISNKEFGTPISSFPKTFKQIFRVGNAECQLSGSKRLTCYQKDVQQIEEIFRKRKMHLREGWWRERERERKRGEQN